jgi:hypothetical protein
VGAFSQAEGSLVPVCFRRALKNLKIERFLLLFRARTEVDVVLALHEHRHEGLSLPLVWVNTQASFFRPCWPLRINVGESEAFSVLRTSVWRYLRHIYVSILDLGYILRLAPDDL